MSEQLLAELKARCDELDTVRRHLARHAAHEITLRQTDTYFAVPRGRLKLREADGRGAQLIYYERDDVASIKPSRILLAHVAEPVAVTALLAAAVGVRSRVAKRREIWRWEGVQVHLDDVEHLGTFIELEQAVASPAELPGAASHLRNLLDALALSPDALLALSYIDLLERSDPPNCS
jgi:predicted adenylyl cyclase CyaB